MKREQEEIENLRMEVLLLKHQRDTYDEYVPENASDEGYPSKDSIEREVKRKESKLRRLLNKS